ncbi:MAG: cation:dicarboxylase symporter family transporter [Selenomonadaceae bacterium]|nr:cation:dicarboxylase symporter family transporter [Selenomonadaceae bacterium]
MKLSNQNIDAAMLDIEKFFDESGVAQKDRLQLCLVLEESLLRWQEKLGAGENFNFEVYTNNWLNSPKVIIRVRGDAFNPLKAEDSIIPASVMRNLLNYEGTGTIYRYENGVNEITAFTRRERKPIKIPGGSVTISILLAFAVAVPVRFFLPPDAQKFFLESIITPTFQMIMSLILAVNLPLIFISIVSSVCVMEDISTLSEIGTKIVRRFLEMMLLIISATIFFSVLLFPVLTLQNDADSSIVSVADLLATLIPTNIFAAFAEGNVLQVVTIAILLSACMIILGDKVSTLKVCVNEAKILLFKMMELVLKLLPLAIFFIELKLILTVTAAEIFEVWRIVAACCATYLVVTGILLARLALKYKVSVVDFLRKISPVLIIAFMVLSGSASMAKNFEICKNDLKLNEKLCDFWIPLSHSLLAPGTVATLVAYAFFAADFSHATLSVSQILMLAFLAIQLSIFSPKVNGGIVAVITLLLNHFGFSLDAIGLIMVADAVVVNASSVFGMLVRDCELYDVSHEINFEGKSA